MAATNTDRLKRAVELLILLDKLLPVIGLGSLGGAAYGFWATLSAMEPVHAGLVALAAMTLLVLLINGARAFLRHRSQRLMMNSLRIWALSDTFNLRDAAEILARSYEAREVSPYFRTLKDWATSGRLSADGRNEQGEFWVWSRISKAELIRIAPDFGRHDPFN